MDTDTDTMLSQRLNSPILSLPKLNGDPKEENDSEIIPYGKDEKVVVLYTKSDLSLVESSYLKWEARTLKKKQVESNDSIDKEFSDDNMEPCIIAFKMDTNDINEIAAEELNIYDVESSCKSERLESEEVHIKHEEDSEDRLKNEKEFNEDDNSDDEFQKSAPVLDTSGDRKKELDRENIDKKFDDDTKDLIASGPIKEETLTENATCEELTQGHGNQSVLLQCPECPFKTKYKASIKKHSIKHKNPYEIHWYSCVECPYKTCRKSDLTLHAEIHNNLILNCSKCSFETSRPTSLKKHHKIHSCNIEWLHCPECSFKTHKASSLQIHLLAHERGTFKCFRCSYKAKTKKQLTIHHLKHESKAKWHKCPFCRYKTYDKSRLNRHYEERHSSDHNSPKPIQIFKCTDCSFDCRLKSTMKRHRLKHDRSSWLQCSDCAYKTPHKISLTRHRMGQHGENGRSYWHWCSECSYKTASDHNFQCHVMSHKFADKIPRFECNFQTAYQRYLMRHKIQWGQKCSSNNEFTESAPIHTIKNRKEELDQKKLDLCLEEPFYNQRGTRTPENIQDESNDRDIDKVSHNDVMEYCAIKMETNDVMEYCAIKMETNDVNEIPAEELNYSHEGSPKTENIKWEEVYMNHEEDRLKMEKNIDKEFDNDVNILIESGAIKRESDTENSIAEELNYHSEGGFQPETIQPEEGQLKCKKDEKGKLNKKTRIRGNPLVLHQCPECPYSTSRKCHLTAHSIKHKKRDEMVWYSCQECHYKTYRKANLKIHAEIHSNLILKCSQCSYETFRPTNLKKHEIKHKTDIERLHCSDCSFKTHLPSLFRTHVLAHKSDAFKCPECPYQSRTKGQLTVHQIKHESRDKWHFCPLCLYKTYAKGTLEAHYRRRHSTDPNNPKQIEIFKCTECPYENGDKYNVQRHQLIHDQSSWLKCPDCAYKTPYKSLFKKHQLRHQGENAEGWHRCLECPYKTAHKPNLRIHVLSHKSANRSPGFECSAGVPTL